MKLVTLLLTKRVLNNHISNLKIRLADLNDLYQECELEEADEYLLSINEIEAEIGLTKDALNYFENYQQ